MDIVSLLTLCSLAAASPIPQCVYTPAEHYTLITSITAGYETVTNAVMDQYTTLMIALTPAQQIGVIVGATFTLTIIQITLIYVIIQARRQNNTQNAQVFEKKKPEPELAAAVDSAFLLRQLNVLTTRQTISTHISMLPVFLIDEIISAESEQLDSALTKLPSPCEEMIPAVASEVISKSADDKANSATRMTYFIDNVYADLLKSIMTMFDEPVKTGRVNQASEEYIGTPTSSDLPELDIYGTSVQEHAPPITKNVIRGKLSTSTVTFGQTWSNESLEADIAMEII